MDGCAGHLMEEVIKQITVMEASYSRGGSVLKKPGCCILLHTVTFGRNPGLTWIDFWSSGIFELVLRTLPLETVVGGDTGFVLAALEPCLHTLT